MYFYSVKNRRKERGGGRGREGGPEGRSEQGCGGQGRREREKMSTCSVVLSGNKDADRTRMKKSHLTLVKQKGAL